MAWVNVNEQFLNLDALFRVRFFATEGGGLKATLTTREAAAVGCEASLTLRGDDARRLRTLLEQHLAALDGEERPAPRLNGWDGRLPREDAGARLAELARRDREVLAQEQMP